MTLELIHDNNDINFQFDARAMTSQNFFNYQRFLIIKVCTSILLCFNSLHIGPYSRKLDRLVRFDDFH